VRGWELPMTYPSAQIPSHSATSFERRTTPSTPMTPDTIGPTPSELSVIDGRVLEKCYVRRAAPVNQCSRYHFTVGRLGCGCLVVLVFKPALPHEVKRMITNASAAATIVPNATLPNPSNRPLLMVPLVVGSREDAHVHRFPAYQAKTP
jgi:hypothetical protein